MSRHGRFRITQFFAHIARVSGTGAIHLISNIGGSILSIGSVRKCEAGEWKRRGGIAARIRPQGNWPPRCSGVLLRYGYGGNAYGTLVTEKLADRRRKHSSWHSCTAVCTTAGNGLQVGVGKLLVLSGITLHQVLEPPCGQLLSVVSTSGLHKAQSPGRA